MSKPLLETLQAGTRYLERHGVDEARLNMEHLLAHVLDCRRLDLYLRFGEPIHEPDLARLRDLTRRRADGTPLQHLLGTVPFGDIELVTDQRALIPRPETEYLCDLLIKRFAANPPARILDMACGSGCIGLALAHTWKNEGSHVTLADLSEEALDLARLNASRLHLDNVHLLRSNLFEKISGTFDLIVSNLPYIPTAEIPALSREVRRDPFLALDGGPDGLDLVRCFVQTAPAFLNENGLIALEVGQDQPPEVSDLLKNNAWRSVETLPDLASIPRFVLAKKPTPTE
jgi:release factor glutamine methyltransferase